MVPFVLPVQLQCPYLSSITTDKDVQILTRLLLKIKGGWIQQFIFNKYHITAGKYIFHWDVSGEIHLDRSRAKMYKNGDSVNVMST